MYRSSLSLIAIMGFLFASNAAAQLDPSFNAGQFYHSSGSLSDIAIQGDGHLLVGGLYERIDEVTQPFLSRVLTDGSIDPTFAPNLNNYVSQVEVQGDGRIVIAGRFSTVNGMPAQRLARLEPDGTLDASFLGTGPFINSVEEMLIDSSGNILVAGDFNSINGVGQGHLARLKVDGSLDASFTPTINDDVLAVALQTDGKLLIGGTFTQVNGVVRNRLARLNANGSLDLTFDPNVAAPYGRGVRSIDVNAAGDIVIAGGYTTIGGASAHQVTRLTPTGGLVPSFESDISNVFQSIKVRFTSLDRVLVGGIFTVPYSSPVTGSLLRLNPNGAVDSTFDPDIDWTVFGFEMDSSANAVVFGYDISSYPFASNPISRVADDGSINSISIAKLETPSNVSIEDALLLSSGNILVVGSFSSIDNVPREHIARLHPNGGVDLGFSAEADDKIYNVVEQSDGKIVISGLFKEVNGAANNWLARLNVDGTSDATFSANSLCGVKAIKVLSSDNILAIGCFLDGYDFSSPDIVVLNASGSVLPEFNQSANINDAVYSIVEQSDGKILLGGRFTQVNGVDQAYLARLNADGTLDATFTPTLDSSVQSIIITSSGKIGIAGFFSQTNGESQGNFALLNNDGSLVESFSPSVNPLGYSLAELATGQIVIGGTFSSINGQGQDSVARLNLDGSLDQSLNPAPNGSVQKLLVLPDDKLLIIGQFKKVSGVERVSIARIDKFLPPKLSISPSNIQKAEGDIGVSSFTYSVSRAFDPTVAVDVDFTVSGIGVNQANAADFGQSFPVGRLSFVENELSKVLEIDVLSDYQVESNEQFSVTLSNPSLGSIGVQSANALIINDDTNDSDNDLIAAGGDNCPSHYNPDQIDTDSNNVGDVCDDDDDGDAVNDADDNCPLLKNQDQLDTDGDEIGDECDVDDDNDGVEDELDRHALDPLICRDLDADLCDDCSVGVDQFGLLADFDINNDGFDTDSDGACDVGDLDDDGDGVDDLNDNCPLLVNPGQEDENGFEDGVDAGDACEAIPSDLCIPVTSQSGGLAIICL